MSLSMVRMTHPTKTILQSILNRPAIVHLYGGTMIAGTLHQTEEEQFRDIPELHYKPNYYCLTHFQTNEHASLIFRCSHIEYLLVFDFGNAVGSDIVQHTMMDLSSHYYPQTYEPTAN